MRRAASAVFATGFIFLFVAASPQDKGQQGMSQQKPMHVMGMMNDSSMMAMMMDHIASDPHMRMTMLHKMMSHAKSDTSSMMEMCKTIMDDKDVHSCMMKTMEGGMMKHDGMMHHDMMHGKSSNTKKDTTKEASHGEHHEKDR